MAGVEDHRNDKQVQEPGFVSDDDYIRKLLDGESANGGLQSLDPWALMARLDGIDYIFEKSGVLGFTILTKYTAVAYLDKFLSKKSVDSPWDMKLLSIACLSLAVKMEEVFASPLQELCADLYTFPSSHIQRMELLVLSELGWNMGIVTPFSFIDYFANKMFLFDHSAPTNSDVSRIKGVVLGATGDVKIMSLKPSVIAVAATLFVLDGGLAPDALRLKIAPLASSFNLDIESIMSCYYKIRLSAIISDLSPVQIQRNEPPYGIGTSARTRRLVFNQCDEEKGKP